VEKAVLVHEGEALEDLEHDGAHARLGQVPLARLAHLVQVALQELKHKVQLVVLADDLLELDDVGVVELAQAAHLAQRNALLPAVELFLHVLDGHHLPSLPVHALVHGAIGAVAQQLGHLVALHCSLGGPSRRLARGVSAACWGRQARRGAGTGNDSRNPW